MISTTTTTTIEVYNWVLTAWEKVKVSTIVNGFRKCGILPADEETTVEDSEDDDDSDEDEASETVSADDEERLQQVMEMFGVDTNNESFDGYSGSDDEDSGDSND